MSGGAQLTGGKGSDNQSQRLMDGYTRGYNSYQPGVDPWSLTGGHSNLADAYVQGWNTAAAERAAQQSTAFGLESAFSALAAQQEAFNQQQEDYADTLAEQQRQAKIDAAVLERDNLYSSRMDAADAAVDFVNAQISQEQSNAALFNIDYKMSDELTAARINNYFATLWGEGDETQLANLMAEYGAPEGHQDFTVIRGDASAYESTVGSEEVVSTSSGTKPKAPLGNEEDGLGGAFTSLG